MAQPQRAKDQGKHGRAGGGAKVAKLGNRASGKRAVLWRGVQLGDGGKTGALGNAQGGLPFTVVIDAAGRLVHRKMGETSLDEMVAWAAPGG